MTRIDDAPIDRRKPLLARSRKAIRGWRHEAGNAIARSQFVSRLDGLAHLRREPISKAGDLRVRRPIQ